MSIEVSIYRKKVKVYRKKAIFNIYLTNSLIFHEVEMVEKWR